MRCGSQLLFQIFQGSVDDGLILDDAYVPGFQVRDQLPCRALQHLQPIIDRALASQDYAEAIKAIAQRIALEATIEGNKPEEKITRMEAAIAEAHERYAEREKELGEDMLRQNPRYLTLSKSFDTFFSFGPVPLLP